MGVPAGPWRPLGLVANPGGSDEREFVRQAVGLAMVVEGDTMENLREDAQLAMVIAEEAAVLAQRSAAMAAHVLCGVEDLADELL